MFSDFSADFCPFYILETWSVFFGKEFVTIFNSTFLSKWAFVQFFFHAWQMQSATYNQISAVSVNENKYAHQLQTGLVWYVILKFHGNEMRLVAPVTSALRTSLTRLHREPFISIRKKNILWNPGYPYNTNVSRLQYILKVQNSSCKWLHF